MIIKNKTYTLLDILSIPLRCVPILASSVALYKLLIGIVPTIEVLVTANFIDTAISIVQNGTKASKIYPSLIMVVLLIAFNWISWQFMRFVEIRFEIKMREKIRPAVLEKWARLDYCHIEDSKMWDILLRVGKEPENKIMWGFTNFFDLVSMVVRVAGIFVVMATQVWWASFVLVAVSSPLFYLSIKSGKETYDVWSKVSQIDRERTYYSEILTGRDATDERTIFGFSEKMLEIWHRLYEKARLKKFKILAKWFVRMKSGAAITSLISIIVIVVLLDPVLSGKLSIGMFMALVNSIMALVQAMSWQLTFNIDELSKYMGYLKDFTVFSKLNEIVSDENMSKAEIPDFYSLEFKNVTFHYPNTTMLILKNISFKIEAGKHYAFVGINGAGKTTIIKLLTGLYKNYEGTILINDKDIKTYTDNELKAFFAIVNQDFAKYYISFKDNIAIGDLNGTQDIDFALKMLELESAVDKLPEGLETPLGKIDDSGVDLSGGQWQRVAMARAVVNPSPLRILDEPTSALDPISESNLYETFEQISRGKTTIFISHRLGSTKLAQEIFVIGDGCVLEKGTHEELMNIHGLYAEMYESQRSWYL